MLWVYGIALLLVFGTVLSDVWLDIDFQRWANIALLAIAVLVTTFGALYGLRSRWRTNPIGKVFFAKSMVLPLVLWQGAASSWLSTEYPGRQHVRFVIYALGVAVYIPMLISLYREQQRDRDREADT
ncbi:hypothetical protein B1R94_02430 [Mycolicibacterium litorale]|nr:hypothetical protein B1R94_02430 [Mycolicibacterium litorale]